MSQKSYKVSKVGNATLSGIGHFKHTIFMLHNFTAITIVSAFVYLSDINSYTVIEQWKHLL